MAFEKLKNLEKVRNDFLKLFPELNYLINKLYDPVFDS